MELTTAEARAAYREYAALVTYWWGVHALVAAADEDERQRRRAERLPPGRNDEAWEQVTYMRRDRATGHWERYTDGRARC